MAEVSEVILKIGVDSSGVFENLDKIKSKYGESTAEVRKQNEELAKLTAEEARLISARAKANNPNQIVALNAELKKTQTQIAGINKSLAGSTQAINSVDSSAKTLNKDLKQAFDGTAIEGVEKKTISLKGQLRLLKAQLAETEDDAEFERLSIEAGKLEDKIGDASNAAQIFASDSKFEVLGSALGNVGSKLLALDFDGAVQGSKLLVKASSQITFKDALGGIKQVGQTLFNVGKALLTNPLFLIGAAVALIIANFEKLKNSGGVIGSIFKGIGKIIDGVIDTFFALTDAIGLTSKALDDLAEKTAKNFEDQAEAVEKSSDRIIRILKAQGKDTIQAETDKNVKLATLNNLAFLNYRDNLLRQGKTFSDLSEDEIKKIKEFGDKKAELQTQLLEIAGAKDKEASDKFIEQKKKENDIITGLFKEIANAQDANQLALIDDKTISGAKQKADLLTTIAKDQIEQETKERLKGVTNQKTIALITALEKEKEAQLIVNIEREKNAKIKELTDAQTLELINKSKTLTEIQIENAELATNGEVDSYSARIGVAVSYYDGLISLAQKNGEDTAILEAQKNAILLKLDKEHQKEVFSLADNALVEEERHQLALLDIAGSKNAEKLALEIGFEEARLQLLIDSGTATEAEIKKQQNKIEELRAESNEEISKMDEERTQEYLSNLQTITDATLKAVNEILSAEIKRVDGQISLQQKRVDEATRIAENGNAQLLELEKKRLDDLTKEKEKFVRAQQALASLELIANTAIAISKAAAQGGAGAAVTIAAALIALIAGLASARSIAGQAAFYEGGYTGDGNPREASSAIGSRPYTYHKGEFVHNHKTTKKYRQIFEDIHSGKVDLNEMKARADMYEMLKLNNIDTSRETIIRGSESSNSLEIGKLKTSIDSVVEAIKSQPGMSVNFDENGIAIITSRYYKNKKRIDSIS